MAEMFGIYIYFNNTEDLIYLHFSETKSYLLCFSFHDTILIDPYIYTYIFL